MSLPLDSSELSSATAAGGDQVAELCPACENRYMPDAKYCRNCGRPRDVPPGDLHDEQEAEQCPNCSNVYAVDAVFCRKCGHKRGEAVAPTMVQGGMSADFDDESSDGEAPRQPDLSASSALTASPQPLLAAEPVTAAAAPSSPPSVAEPVTAVSPPTASPSEETKKQQLRAMLGEDSSENDEDESPPARQSPVASLGGGLASLAKAKAAPKAKSPSAQRPWQSSAGIEDVSEEEEDVEEILKRDLAEKTSIRSPSRGSSTGSLTQPKPAPSGPPPPRVGVAGAAEANSISLLSLGASSPGQEIGAGEGDVAEDGADAAAPEGSNSWDSGSDASPSPTAKKALGLDSPSLSPATSPAAGGPGSGGAPAGIAPPAASSAMPASPAGIAPPAASSAMSTSPAGTAPPGAKAAAQLASSAGSQSPVEKSAEKSGGLGEDAEPAEEVSDEYDSDAFDEADDLPI